MVVVGSRRVTAVCLREREDIGSFDRNTPRRLTLSSRVSNTLVGKLAHLCWAHPIYLICKRTVQYSCEKMQEPPVIERNSPWKSRRSVQGSADSKRQTAKHSSGDVIQMTAADFQRLQQST